ncbi:MAG: alpha/beta hydrolase [Candidatus Devosia symbiotica]|nr:alpha/beta hydrolase [Candidatus Devosia symbiotica]
MSAQRQFQAIDDTSLRYRDAGPLAGPTIVLCHGLAAGGNQFEVNAAHFATLGYRVLVPDLRGHSCSGACIRIETVA